MRKPGKRMNVYIYPDLEHQLRERGYGKGEENVVARDLTRYYELLRLALKRVHLTAKEWNFLYDALNGMMVTTELLPYLPQAIAQAAVDASYDGFAEKWDVDVEELYAKLSHMTPLEAVAVVDAVERFWEHQRK